MRRKILMVMFLLLLTVLAACNNDTENKAEQDTEEVKTLVVDFEVPEKADVGETVVLKATVTYGDEEVKDADDVNFEYWLQGDEDNTTTIESTNNEDGTYTAEVSFESDGVYEIYAHTTARDLHTMPKKSITVGEGVSTDHGDGHDNDEDSHEHGGHDLAEGFSMHFVKPEDVKVNQEIELMVHLQLDNEPLEQARVRYEIYQEGSEKHDWIDVEESVAGEYTNSHSFIEEGMYTIVIHVENDEGLHEHTEHQMEVTK
ncbi:FixH family protein [Paucisalibacillus globulus]|uniref:FixH family protein n=1 Tax=Paucisalibacillus globulus TaxID=351095 RepID=UPI000427E777|nr:FixH family protein [Paucisalibacillus globulus]